MKKIIVCLLLLVLTFLYIDNKAYYYGQGFGLITSKIPPMYSVLYAGSDLGYQGIIIKENDMGGHLVRPFDSIFVQLSSGKEDKVIVKKIIGYGFKDNSFLIKVQDVNNKLITAEIHGIDFVKRKKIPPDYKYIDLDKSQYYFTRFFLVRKIIIILLILTFIYLIIKTLKKIKTINFPANPS
jgi:hypothetical protein